ncbi:Oligosaccharide translocation protein rft1 [Coemansia sp. Benny D115]|nr:Oligosaccharide translocation protein rft1 [Coemansia sp. Benny D115]
MPYYRASLVVYVVAAWVELLVEPLFVLSRARVEFKLQARSEAFSVSMRCLATATVLVVGARQSKDGSNQYQLLAFALGQLAYASSILASYAWQMQSLLGFTLRQCYIPRKVTVDDQQESVLVGRHMQSLVAVFVGQSLLKHVLTQGDSMVMAKYAKPDEMGIFALVSSYASIPARILFLPLEEAARAVFPHCDASTAKRVLTTLFRLQTLLGSLACVFGGLYAPVLLPLLGQDQAVARVLAAYCFYLPLMGVNGFLEAYVHSVVARRQLLWVNVCMALCSIAYVSLAALLLTRWDMGGLGMVVANMVNMALRILGCCWFASLWFAAQKVALPRFTELVPHPAVSVACCLSAVLSIVAIQSIGQESVLHRLATMATGSLLASLVLATIWRYEQPFIRAVLELRSGKFIKHEKTD